MEDHYGDMDFKVAGTREGITALQMDIKVTGISQDILREALAQAHKGRMQILDNMEACIAEPRPDVSKWAPKMDRLIIPVDKIRIVIGKGGEMIDKIIESCQDVKIDIEDDGSCVIYHMDREMIDKAKEMIENLIKEAKVGEIYEACVTDVRESFAFVNLFGSVDALLHVSQLSWERVENIKDKVRVGDHIRVKVIQVDETGKVKVSAKELLEKPEGYVETPRKSFKPQKIEGETRVFRKKKEEKA